MASVEALRLAVPQKLSKMMRMPLQPFEPENVSSKLAVFKSIRFDDKLAHRALHGDHQAKLVLPKQPKAGWSVKEKGQWYALPVPGVDEPMETAAEEEHLADDEGEAATAEAATAEAAAREAEAELAAQRRQRPQRRRGRLQRQWQRRRHCWQKQQLLSRSQLRRQSARDGHDARMWRVTAVLPRNATVSSAISSSDFVDYMHVRVSQTVSGVSQD